jgi:predicted ATPase
MEHLVRQIAQLELKSGCEGFCPPACCIGRITSLTAKVIPRALKVKAKTIYRLEAEDLRQGSPFLAFRSIDKLR